MKKNSGQSLIEVVTAIAVVVLILVALVAVTTVSVRNATFSRNKALATKYAQEGIEKVRAYRDQTDWTTFTNNCSNPPGLGVVPSPFSRTITCEVIDENNREVTVTVSWTDAQGTHKSELTTHLTKWAGGGGGMPPMPQACRDLGGTCCVCTSGNQEPISNVTDCPGICYRICNQPPTVSLSATPSQGREPLTVTFTGTSSDPDGISSCQLNFGDGSSITPSNCSNFNVSHTYQNCNPSHPCYIPFLGYCVCGPILTVTDNRGCTAEKAIGGILFSNCSIIGWSCSADSDCCPSSFLYRHNVCLGGICTQIECCAEGQVIHCCEPLPQYSSLCSPRTPCFSGQCKPTCF